MTGYEKVLAQILIDGLRRARLAADRFEYANHVSIGIELSERADLDLCGPDELPGIEFWLQASLMKDDLYGEDPHLIATCDAGASEKAMRNEIRFGWKRQQQSEQSI